MRDNKVSGQLTSKPSNHNIRLGSDKDYVSPAHRLGNEVMRIDVREWISGYGTGRSESKIYCVRTGE